MSELIFIMCGALPFQPINISKQQRGHGSPEQPGPDWTGCIILGMWLRFTGLKGGRSTFRDGQDVSMTFAEAQSMKSTNGKIPALTFIRRVSCI